MNGRGEWGKDQNRKNKTKQKQSNGKGGDTEETVKTTFGR